MQVVGAIQQGPKGQTTITMAKKKKVVAKKKKAAPKKKKPKKVPLQQLRLIDLDGKELGEAFISANLWASLNRPQALVPAHIDDNKPDPNQQNLFDGKVN